MFTLGLDIGSAASKCVISEDGAKIAAHALVPAGIGTGGAEQAVEAALASLSLTPSEIHAAAVTGYGRNTYAGDGLRISELTAHAVGAHFIFSDVKTVIDIGGQDSKVIALDEHGRMTSFLMNDKCAAGTGRFLEVMARVLGVGVGELSDLAKAASAPVSISSTCTVFAESEVISQLAGGATVGSVAAGIAESVAVRTASLVKRLGVCPNVCMSGGVAHNEAVRGAVSRALGCEILYSPLAQMFGALGAAVYAFQKAK